VLGAGPPSPYTLYRRAPNTFTFQMIYRQGHEFPGFSQNMYGGPTRISRISQMVYSSKWFTSRVGSASAPRRPAHGPLGCGSSGSGVLLALLARLPLGLHVALDLSPIDLHFRPFPKVLPSRARVSAAPNNPYFWAHNQLFRSKTIWSPTVYPAAGRRGMPP
jgi:hypothetical protein